MVYRPRHLKDKHSVLTIEVTDVDKPPVVYYKGERVTAINELAYKYNGNGSQSLLLKHYEGITKHIDGYER